MNTFEKEYLKILKEENEKKLIFQSTFSFLEQAIPFSNNDGTAILGTQPNNVISTIDKNIEKFSSGALSILKSPIEAIKQKGKALTPYIQQGLAPLKNGGNIQSSLTSCSNIVGKKTNSNIVNSLQQSLSNAGLKIQLPGVSQINESKQFNNIINEHVKSFCKELKTIIIEDAKIGISPNMWFNKNAKFEQQKPIIFEDSTLYFYKKQNKLICQEQKLALLEKLQEQVYNDTNAENESLKKRVEDLTQQKKDLLTGNTQLSLQLYKARQQEEVLNNAITNTTNKLNVVTKQISEKETEITRLTEVIKNAESKASEEAVAAKQRIESLSNEINSLKEEKIKFKEEINKLQKTLERKARARIKHKELIKSKKLSNRLKSAYNNSRLGTKFRTRDKFTNKIMWLLAWFFDLICSLISLILQLIVFCILLLFKIGAGFLNLFKKSKFKTKTLKQLWNDSYKFSTHEIAISIIQIFCIIGIYKLISNIISIFTTSSKEIMPQINLQQKNDIFITKNLPGFIF